MSIDVRKVRNRRKLRFSSLKQVLAEANRLAQAQHAGQLRQLGNMSLAQALEHLARWFDASIDGTPVSAPLPLRILGRALRPLFLRITPPPGARPGPEAEAVFVPAADTQLEPALAHFVSSLERLQTTDQRRPSPMFGAMNAAQWEMLHLRHCELHFSFFTPGE